MYRLRSSQAVLWSPTITKCQFSTTTVLPRVTSRDGQPHAATSPSSSPTRSRKKHEPLGRLKYTSNRNMHRAGLPESISTPPEIQMADLFPLACPSKEYDPLGSPFVPPKSPQELRRHNPFSNRSRLNEHVATSQLHVEWPYMPDKRHQGVFAKDVDTQLDWALTEFSKVQQTMAWKDRTPSLEKEAIKRVAVEKWIWMRDNIAQLMPQVRRLEDFYQEYSRLRSAIFDLKLKDPVNLILPSLTELYQMTLKLGNLQKSIDRIFLIALKQAEYVLDRLQQTSTTDESGGLHMSEDVDYVLDAIVEDQEAFWKLVFTAPQPSKAEDIVGPLRTLSIPRLPFKTLYANGMSLDKIMHKLVPYFNPNACKSFPAALMSWYLIFISQSSNTRKWGAQFTHITHVMNKMMLECKVQGPQVRELMKGFDEVFTKLQDLRLFNPNTTQVTFASQSRYIHKKVTQARDRNQVGQIRHFLQEFQAMCSGCAIVNEEERTIQRQTLNFFLNTFCALDDTGGTDVAFKLLKIGGHPIDHTVYTSMISGWAKARRLDKIEALWKKLKADGTWVDDVFWVARIDALGRLQHCVAAVNALNEMEELHKNSEYGTAPTISTVNAVLTALVRSRDLPRIHALVEWAREWSLEADIVTYNLLITAFRNANQSDQISETLSLMEANEITPDINTYTILLADALRASTSEVSVSEKVKAVLGIIEDFKSRDEEVKNATYSKILHVILNDDSNSFAAAQAVLDHMASRKFMPTRHHLTILFNYYFRYGRVDLVHETLITCQIDQFNSDYTFWNTILSGFARNNDLESLQHYEGVFRRKFHARGPSISTECDILITLCTHGLEDEARVRAIEAAKAAKRRNEDNERFWGHRYWRLVEERFGIVGRDIQMEIERNIDYGRIDKRLASALASSAASATSVQTSSSS